MNKKILFWGGGIVGIANSLLGGGGGMLAVPLLKKSCFSEQKAHATALLVIFPITLLSFIVYMCYGFYNFRIFVPTALGGILGSVLGAKILDFLPEKTVKCIFAIMQLVAGLWMIFYKFL